MVLQWFSCGFPIDSCGFPLVFLWSCYGFTMVFLLFYYGFAMSEGLERSLYHLTLRRAGFW